LASRRFFAVKEKTVVEAELNVVDKLLHGEVVVVVQSLLDCAEVNWFFYDVEVVWNAKPVGIYWLMEDRSCVASP